MREVIPGLVWIGNAGDAQDVMAVMSLEITAVVELAMEEVPRHFPRELIHCRFPLVDGAGNPTALLRTSIHTLATLIQTKTPTLVVCSGGMSRSPAVTAAALSVANGGSPDEWLKQITATGPHDVAPTLWNDIHQLVLEDPKCQKP